jgi:glycine C-acetyltransferase
LISYEFSGASSLAASQSFVRNVIEPQLEEIRNAGTYKSERVILTKQGVQVSVEGVKQKLLNFCANNYLGLSVSCRLFILLFGVVDSVFFFKY